MEVVDEEHSKCTPQSTQTFKDRQSGAARTQGRATGR